MSIYLQIKTLWLVLSPPQRLSALGMLNLMIIGMALEALGVGLVIPALVLLEDGSNLARYPAVTEWVQNVWGNPTHVQLVVAGMLMLAAVYVAKTIFLGFMAWRQAKFVFGLEAYFSHKLFARYLRQPYTFHLKHNSAQLVQYAITEVRQFSIGTVRAAMVLLAELLVMAGIVALLFFVEPIGAMIVIVTLGATGLGFYRFAKTRLTRWGTERQFHEGKRLQHMQQGLGGAKEVKLYGREAEFLNKYAVNNQGVAQAFTLQNTFEALPRLWLELLAVLALVALVLTMLAQGKQVGALIPTVGLFAAAAFRLMPSVNRILTAMQNLRYTLPVIEVMVRELSLPEPAPMAPLRARIGLPVGGSLRLENIGYTYADSKVPALRNIHLEIEFGKTMGFIGGSGAGKSTLIDLILGLLSPTQGKIKVGDADIADAMRAWQDQVGYVPQSIYLTDDSLRRNIAFGIPDDQIDEVALAAAIDAAQLTQFVAAQSGGLDAIVGERGVRLSGGQRQRIGIARALYHNPAVLVLDEATSSLDVATERDVMEAVNALHGEKTILIVAHRLSTVEESDIIVRMEHGEIVEIGTPAELLKPESAQSAQSPDVAQ